MKKYRFEWILFLTTLGLYILFFTFNEPVDFQSCKLCDGKQYLKLYQFFESGTVSQIAYPFYTRPVVPFLASLIPGDSPALSFHLINGVFILLSIICIRLLWQHLQLSYHLQWVGFGWLLIHWTGIIRYNLFDYVTVDVPLYFVQSCALLLFFKRKYSWFYLLAPLAILQKESFLAIMVVLLAIHIIEFKKNWFAQGKHLLFSLILGVLIQKSLLAFLPDQMDQRNSFLAILWHAKFVIDDPTRLIRWFAAFGSAFGILPFILMFRIKKVVVRNRSHATLLLLSAMYGAFGLLAGEDMTRILFLGFPFIMTLTLLLFQQESKWTLIVAVALSLVSLRMVSLPIQNSWGVDYAPHDYVYQWATYYLIAILLFALYFRLTKTFRF